MFDNLNESNFILYAAKNYDNPSCYNTEEFHDDLKRFKYLKKLFTRYEETDELKERLILNHIIVLYNLFGNEATTKMLFYKMRGYYHLLKPFLLLIGRMPEKVDGIDGKSVINSDIIMDPKIVNVLRKI